MVRAEDVDGVPWEPAGLPVSGEALRSWSYVVLEEIVEDVALLRRWAWPLVDEFGRLVWPTLRDPGTQTAVVDVGLLVVQLYRPTGLWRRPRGGDVFAVEAVGRGWRRSGTSDLVDVASVFAGELYDVSDAARRAAKVAHLSAVTPVTQQRTSAVTVVVLDGTPPIIGRRERRSQP